MKAKSTYRCLFPALLCSLSLCACTRQLHFEVSKQPDQTAEEHLLQAQRYRQAGRIELSRASLLKAINTDSNSHAAKLARQYLQYNLPKQPIAQEAEQRNVIAFNQYRNGDIQGAKHNLTSLIKDFPDFEWPYANLATIYIREHSLDEAEKLLHSALRINPDYTSAKALLTRIQSIRIEKAKNKSADSQIQPD